ncbi:putative Ig domain-containing protein [Gallaecimonas sp. GXIMD4217]|uniref:putative Ig domain-containing protein n=1 Tax=Gallaecimonas sp. GXIMD4217 TaxID=3131927 RepID=UPI00311B0DBC
MIRSTGKPVVETFQFSLPPLVEPREFHIYNGGRNGEYCRISSAEAFLNGQQILFPKDLNQQVAVVSVPVQLLEANELSIELRSKPGCGVTFQIEGELINLPPEIISEPELVTPEGVTYRYQVEVTDPNEDDRHAFSLDLAPPGMVIGADDGLVEWLPPADYVQSVPQFNRQCYVVATGLARAHEEDDDPLAYIAPLFQRVKTAIVGGGDYTAREAVAWHQRHQCLGCHIQTQSLLGLETSRGKVDIDEESAQYLLEELLSSQQDDGSIRRSHPHYSKNQTALALWSLSSVPEFEQTLDVRAKAIEFFLARQQSENNGSVYWTDDHKSGWLRSHTSISAMVAYGITHYLSDLDKLEPTPEQQELATRLKAQLPKMASYFLGHAYQDENETLHSSFRLIGLAELYPWLDEGSELAIEVAAAMAHLEQLLRSRQLEDGGWNRYGNGNAGDPLTSAWVGIALNYRHPELSDRAVSRNIEFLLNTQQSNGTWRTNSGLFQTRLSTTSLVMAYLPIALEHLGNPDLRVGHVFLREGEDGVAELEAHLQNRGLADITSDFVVRFYKGGIDGEALGEQLVSGLPSKGQVIVTLPVDTAFLDDDVHVVVESATELDECQIGNNQSVAALVKVRATDLGGLFDTQSFLVNVDDVNSAPRIVNQPPSVLEGGQPIAHQVVAEDDDRGDALHYELIEAPAGLFIDPRTGRLSSDPRLLQPGVHEVLVRVTDLRGASDEQAFTLTVNENLPPQIVSAAVQRGQESLYRYQLEARDPNPGDILRFGVDLAPGAMVVDAAGGELSWVAEDKWLDPLTSENHYCYAPELDLDTSLTPKLKWARNTDGMPLAQYNQVMHAPVVVPLYDTNGNGHIDDGDERAIVYHTFLGRHYQGDGVLRAISAKDGRHLWTVTETAYRTIPAGSIAAGDIDNDGFVEIIAPRNGGGMVAFEHDGTFKWFSSNRTNLNWGGPSLYDLDGDGDVEIIAGNQIFDHQGQLIWAGSGSSGSGGAGPLSFAADLDLDGQLEVIAGAAVYRNDGTKLFDKGEGFAAIGNFDDDQQAEVVVVLEGYMSLYNHDGSRLWRVAIPGGGGGAPTVADLTGDGRADIGVAGKYYYVTFDRTGRVIWQKQSRDYSSRKTGSSVFDFNADGRAEIVYADEVKLRIFDGPTGEVLYQVANTSDTTYELPVIVDADNDGHAEIVVIANNYARSGYAGIRVFEEPNDRWAPTRGIWNQHAYHIDNVNDDGSIPRTLANSWLSHNTFRLNTFAERNALALPDLVVHDIQWDQAGQRLSVAVSNRGLAPTLDEAQVKLTHEHYWTGDSELGSLTVPALGAGETVRLAMTLANADILVEAVRAELAADGIRECQLDNNQTRAAVVQANVFDQGGLSDHQSFLVSLANENDAPRIASGNTWTLAARQPGSLQIQVADPDKGDAFLYGLEEAPDWVTIDRISGALSASPVEPGIYQAKVKVTDLGGLSAEQHLLITVTEGANQAPRFSSEPALLAPLGEDYLYLAKAEDPEGDEVAYALDKSPAGMFIDGVSGEIRWRPSEAQKGLHEVVVKALDPHGAASLQSFTLEVTDPRGENHAPQITSEPQGIILAGVEFRYQVVAEDPDGDILSYRLERGAAGMALGDDGLFRWLPSTAQVGKTFVVDILVDDGRGGLAKQTLTLPVSEGANAAPKITSEPETLAWVGQAYGYQLLARDPDGDALRFQLEQGPNGLAMSEQGLVSWTPSARQAGQIFEVVLKVVDARGAAAIQRFGIAVNQAAGDNQAPQILSAAPSPALVGEEYRYQLVATDRDGDELSYSLVRGPQGAQFSAGGLLSWTAGAEQLGEHDITLQVSDGQALVSQSFVLTVIDGTGANRLPSIHSQPGLEAVAEHQYRYQLSATDPDGDALSYGLAKAPQGMDIDPNGLISWTPSLAQAGNHEVQVFVSDGQGRAQQSYSVYVADQPQALDVQISISETFADEGEAIHITVSTSGGIGDISKRLTLDGADIALDPYGQATVIAEGIGRHDLIASASDELESVDEVIYFTVRDDSDSTPPQVALLSPEEHSSHWTPTEVTGRVQDDNLVEYNLYLSPKGKNAWQVLASGSEPVQGLLGQVDTSQLINGQYDLVLQATDLNGATAADSLTLFVEGDLKVGNFTITLEDLNIPVVGIPVRVTRTYDSRRRAEQLDFGYGWSIGYQDVKVEESRAPGKWWSINEYRRGIFNHIVDYCVEPNGDPIVTVTLPDGDVERFKAKAYPTCNTYLPIIEVDLQFEAMGDTQSELEMLGNSHTRLVNGNLVETTYFSEPLDPDQYKLTTKAGYVYYLDQDFGIDKVVDPNGNTLTYSNDGIVHSSGKAIRFHRNSDGRITSISDPNGNVLEYGYDDKGDLVASSDATDATTSYEYNRNHGLVTIRDPLNRPIVRNIYEDGRLVAQEDNEGNRTEFNHDLEGRQSVVTDRNQNVTLYYYNDRGDIVSKQDAEGHVWSYSYDDRGNQLSQTDPLGNVTEATFDERNNQLTQTDALGNTTTYTYNSRGQELTIEDALGNRYINSYDSVGNLLTVKDPNGNLAGNNINAKGLVSSTVDMAGNTTSYTYDEDGNKLTEMDAEGNVSRFSYDENGNLLSETRTRTHQGVPVEETTRYVYDANNRLIETRYPDGTRTRSEYDEAGNEVATIDALERRTEMVYDPYGRVLETRYPDGTRATRTYDPEGNLKTETDRLERTTSYTYDKLNRLVRTDFPGDSFTTVTYDEAGRVVAETDANQNTTRYEYDEAGRRTAVIDARNRRHSFAYDANGNLVSETDARGNTTSYVYNKLGQKVETIYHDGSVTKQEFDKVQRRVAGIDQAQRRTEYGYDKLGRLVEVRQFIDGSTLTTSYGYDEAGNKLTQTDAEGRTTSWSYDSQGRVLSRTLPLGQSEYFEYDELGNVVVHTDFNGQQSHYRYDSNNNVVRIQYQDGEVETMSYDALGNRLSAGNGQGTTYYRYDNRNRLVEERQPGGAVLRYRYDDNGNRTELVLEQGDISSTTHYEFDELNRLVKVVAPDEGVSEYGYDEVGNRTSLRQANGQLTRYQYDDLNRLVRQVSEDGQGNVLADYRYALHATGRRSGVQELHNGRSVAYGYDDLYRLTGETVTDPQAGNYQAEYRYDKVGNRVYSIVDGVHTSYSYDDNDRLTQQGGVSYSYDDNGNTLTETLDADVTRYGYNAKNKLVSVERLQGGTGSHIDYGYNPDGIRTSQTVDGVATRFVVDSNRDYAQVLAEVSNGTTEVSYTYGDDLLAQQRSGATSYYLYDGHGSTRALADEGSAVTDSYHYDAFGNLLASTGDTDNSYRFAGEQYDAGLEQYYLRARYYDQASGRFTQQDTWMGNNHDPITLHKYLYGNADPVNHTDPSGMFGLVEFGVVNNIRSELASQQVNVGLSVLDMGFGGDGGVATPNPMMLGVAAMGGAASFKLLRLLSKKFRKVCGANSFTGDTLVSTEFGLVPIEDIKIGDKVWAFDEETGEKSLEEIIHIIVGEGEKNLVELNFSNGEKVVSTAGHPFFVTNQENAWVDAQYLTKISMLYGFDGDTKELKSTRQFEQLEKVYNLTVDRKHTYFVGINQVLSHNIQKVCSINGLVFGEKKPRFIKNPKHTKGGGGSNGNLPKGLEPDDSEYALANLSVKSEKTGHWYAKSSDGKSIYRYFTDHNGNAHWSGGTGDLNSPLDFNEIPAAVKRAFGFKPNGKKQ